MGLMCHWVAAQGSPAEDGTHCESKPVLAVVADKITDEELVVQHRLLPGDIHDQPSTCQTQQGGLMYRLCVSLNGKGNWKFLRKNWKTQG